MECFSQSVQLLSRVRLFVAPWTAARQASQSITNSWSLLRLMSIESVIPSNHLILCHPILCLPVGQTSTDLLLRPWHQTGHPLRINFHVATAFYHSEFWKPSFAKNTECAVTYYGNLGLPDCTGSAQRYWELLSFLGAFQTPTVPLGVYCGTLGHQGRHCMGTVVLSLCVCC